MIDAFLSFIKEGSCSIPFFLLGLGIRDSMKNNTGKNDTKDGKESDTANSGESLHGLTPPNLCLKISVIKDYPMKGRMSVKIIGCLVTGRTEQNFTPLSFNWMGKELQLGSLFVLKFSLLSDSIGIYDSKYPKANNNVENSVMIGTFG
jgi:hypothetical protein